MVRAGHLAIILGYVDQLGTSCLDLERGGCD